MLYLNISKTEKEEKNKGKNFQGEMSNLIFF